MPKHFLYVMEPNAPAPAGDGDTESWFRFYKWNVEGETFVPRKPPAPFFTDVSPGDFVWFAFYGFGEGARHCALVLGGAQIVRVEDENRMQEIWYRGDDLYELNPPLESEEFRTEVPSEVAEQWLTKATRSRPSPQ